MYNSPHRAQLKNKIEKPSLLREPSCFHRGNPQFMPNLVVIGYSGSCMSALTNDISGKELSELIDGGDNGGGDNGDREQGELVLAAPETHTPLELTRQQEQR